MGDAAGPRRGGGCAFRRHRWPVGCAPRASPAFRAPASPQRPGRDSPAHAPERVRGEEPHSGTGAVWGGDRDPRRTLLGVATLEQGRESRVGIGGSTALGKTRLSSYPKKMKSTGLLSKDNQVSTAD